MINLSELSEKQRKRLIEEIIKLRLRQREKMGWPAVNRQIQLKLQARMKAQIEKQRAQIRQIFQKKLDEDAASKPVIQSLRQFIPYTDVEKPARQRIAEANRYVQKYVFCE